MTRARRSLSSGETRPNTWSCGQPARRARRRTSACSSLPLIAPGPSPSSSPMAFGGDRVVAGDHAHVDAGAERGVDRVLGLGAQRVDDADHADEVEVLRERHRIASASRRARRPRRTGPRTRARAGPARPCARWRRRCRAAASAIGTCVSLSGPPERAHRASTTSGPPLTSWTTRSRPPSVARWKVAMNLYSESNGTSARRG